MLNNLGSFLLEKELTFKLRGLVINISKESGSHFKEKVYQSLIRKELKKSGLFFIEFPKIPLYDFNSGEFIANYYPDFLIENKLILEIKSQKELSDSHVNQLIKYLRISRFEIGLLVNFGTPKAQIFRRIFTNDRKPFLLKNGRDTND